jgi:hypothetical protein
MITLLTVGVCARPAGLQVPDTLLLESAVTPKAVTVSSLLLSWVLSNEQLGMKLYQVRPADGPVQVLLVTCVIRHSKTSSMLQTVDVVLEQRVRSYCCVRPRPAERYRGVFELRQVSGAQG